MSHIDAFLVDAFLRAYSMLVHAASGTAKRQRLTDIGCIGSWEVVSRENLAEQLTSDWRLCPTRLSPGAFVSLVSQGK